MALSVCLTIGSLLQAGSVDSLAKLRLQDAAGHPVRFAFASNDKAIVLLFVSVECPISNSYAPEFKRLAKEFEPKHILVRVVYPNPDETTETIRKHLKEYDLPGNAWRDPFHDLVKLAGVSITPEAAVLNSKGNVLYRGRIDNRYAALGVARPEATEHDLRDALKAVADGKPVAKKTTRAIGCSIAP